MAPPIRWNRRCREARGYQVLFRMKINNKEIKHELCLSLI